MAVGRHLEEYERSCTKCSTDKQFGHHLASITICPLTRGEHVSNFSYFAKNVSLLIKQRQSNSKEICS